MILCQKLVLSLAGYFAVTYSVRNWYFPCGLLRRYLLCQKPVFPLRVTSPLLTLSETGISLAGYFAVTYSVRNWYFPCGLLRRYLLKPQCLTPCSQDPATVRYLEVA